MSVRERKGKRSINIKPNQGIKPDLKYQHITKYHGSIIDFKAGNFNRHTNISVRILEKDSLSFKMHSVNQQVNEHIIVH